MSNTYTEAQKFLSLVSPQGQGPAQTEGKIDDALEALVDKASLGDIITALEDICYGKADHLRSNWQDEAAAKDWEKAGKALDRLTLPKGL